ncbi:MAG: glycerophosphodiester phosphodiesterase family protein [Bacillota bacterium]
MRRFMRGVLRTGDERFDIMRTKMKGSRGKAKTRMVRLVRILLLAMVLCTFVLSVKRFSFCSPKDVAWLRNTPIAHRGLHDEAIEENTLAAFAAAIAEGYAIELDVNLTKDGVPVVIHDNDLSRLMGLDTSVSDMLLDDLKKESLKRSGEKVPTLGEALALIAGQVPVLIEIKNFGWPGRLESEVLNALDGYSGEYALQSFNPLVCRWFAKRDAKQVVGLLLDDIPGVRFGWLRNFKDNVFSAIASPNFIGYNYSVLTEDMAKVYRAHNVTVLGYGLLERALSQDSRDLRVDNIIFDKVTLGH